MGVVVCTCIFTVYLLYIYCIFTVYMYVVLGVFVCSCGLLPPPQVSFSYSPDVPIFKKISLYADMESRIALVREGCGLMYQLDASVQVQLSGGWGGGWVTFTRDMQQTFGEGIKWRPPPYLLIRHMPLPVVQRGRI